jgi:hypothetical protein
VADAVEAEAAEAGCVCQRCFRLRNYNDASVRAQRAAADPAVRSTSSRTHARVGSLAQTQGLWNQNRAEHPC